VSLYLNVPFCAELCFYCSCNTTVARNYKAVVAAWLSYAGVTGLNFDLMYGLPCQTTESVTRFVELSLKLDPDRIALFGYAHALWKGHQTLLPEEALPDLFSAS
jgi:coproporphyrinogen III oxidase-like Fe-S oxidoreductase